MNAREMQVVSANIFTFIFPGRAHTNRGHRELTDRRIKAVKKGRMTVLPAVLLAAFLLAGCAGETEVPSDHLTPSATLPASEKPSPTPPNDAMEGGGAGGTNDTDNDGVPDAGPSHSVRPSGDGPLEDIGDAAGKAADRAGRAIQ